MPSPLSRIIYLTAVLLLLAAGLTVQAQTFSPTMVTASERMVIRAGDLVEVKVFREDDLSGRMRVSADGQVNIPLIGLVDVAGKSPEAAAATIKGKLADGYLVHPDVLVTVADFAKQLFTVMGQVQRPGTYELPASGRLNVLQALGMAGGFTRIANPSKVIIKRSVNGREQVFPVNVKRLSREASAAPVMLQPGDIITVPESLL